MEEEEAVEVEEAAEEDQSTRSPAFGRPQTSSSKGALIFAGHVEHKHQTRTENSIPPMPDIANH